MKLFISHSEKDKDLVVQLVDLLFAVGLTENDMFCSSVREIGIPYKENIYDYLRDIFIKTNVYVLYVLSDAYYQSPACLNEMGASWITKADYGCLLTPGFEFSKIKGAIDPLRVSIKLDSDDASFLLTELKNDIIEKFEIRDAISDFRWERKRIEFLKHVNEHTLYSSQKTYFIDVSKSKAYCINDQIHNGCILLNHSKQTHGFVAQIDFEKTTQDICSVVVFTPNVNWIAYAKNGRHIRFDARTDQEIPVALTLEIRLKASSHRPERTVSIMQVFSSYSFELQDMDEIEMWNCVQELCFLIKRNSCPLQCKIEISNLRIE